MNTQLTNRAADNIRILAASMVEKAKSGHPGGAMGGADFVNVLYSQFLVTDPDDGKWLARDRFFLDPGHMSPMLYSVLALFGHYTVAELQQFRQWGSPTPGHPELHPERGVENTSGPLGQGHTMAVGCAIAERFLAARFGEWLSHKTYAFISDGGIQEEISQGAGRLAGHLGLSNLIMFYDSNKVQLSTMVEAVDAEDVAAKYRAWHWNVLEINGNDPVEIADAIVKAQAETERPTIIIGHTVMGKGCVKADGYIILARIDEVSPQELSIPVGSLTGSVLLAGRGPCISVRMESVGSSSASFENEFTSAGINQTKHLIVLNIDVVVSILLPGFSTATTISNAVTVAETVIVGSVPDTYTYFSSTSENFENDVKDYILK